jgi:GDP/UDP-N,N'-diacetylbacillosamine 2-epimerase (hydrolysing)
MIKVGILTSSRADYGIYKPLLKALSKDGDFDVGLIVFGTHLSKLHGYTVKEIEGDGYRIVQRIESLLLGDSPNSIASSYALTAQKFSDYWQNYSKQFDVIIALGDRFEMAAAIAASLPYGIEIAHIHGGETTLGAIDNVYRHSISLASKLHFVAAYEFKHRVERLLGQDFNENIHHVGSLSLENLESVEIPSIQEFREKWNINLTKDTILATIHPETVEYDRNEFYAEQVIRAFEELSRRYQIVITMPNADTNGLIYREKFNQLAENNMNIHLIENFGIAGYFACMTYSKLMIGNTSSGIIEAASLKRYVINIGDRQKGRLSGKNVLSIPFDADLITSLAMECLGREYNGENPYYQPKPSDKILAILKRHYGKL